MKKIIWIDVGTHFGQEYKSIFGSSLSFYINLIKRLISGGIFKRGKFVSKENIKTILFARGKIRRRAKDFHTIFIEANPKIVCKKDVYLSADDVFNLALIDNANGPLSISKFFLGIGDELSQGSSVFAENNAVDKNTFVTTIFVACDTFFHQLKMHIEELYNDYEILLRLNCEGMEDEVIYSVYNVFGNKTAMICGSLNDVERVRGFQASQRLEEFINEKKLPFVFFSPLMHSWPQAHVAIMNLLDQKIPKDLQSG